MRTFSLSSLVVVSLTAGCQDYSIGNAVEPADLPPPTVLDELPASPPPVPVAEAPVYANTQSELFEVEPTTGERTLIGTFYSNDPTVEMPGFLDIAIDSDGIMYGGQSESDGAYIYLIDPETAEVSRVCQSLTSPTGMAFTPDGTLLIAGGESVTAMDVDTCSEAPVLADAPYRTSGDIVGHPDGYLYWTVVDDDSDGLVRLNPDDWSLRYLGPIPISGLYGVGYADDELFGFSGSGETVAIDPVDADASGWVPTTVLRADAELTWWGATTNPVAWD